jgi:hypothetical protein
MKKFIKGETEINFSSPVSFMQSAACLALLAPYRLVDTVSTVIIYLKKAYIAKMLLYALTISGFITAANTVALVYLGRFSLTRGKLPLVVLIASTIVLLMAYLFFGVVDFTAYSQLDALVADEKCADTDSAAGEAADIDSAAEEAVSGGFGVESATEGRNSADSSKSAENEDVSASNTIGNPNMMSEGLGMNIDLPNGVDTAKDAGLRGKANNSKEDKHYVGGPWLKGKRKIVIGVNLSKEEETSLKNEIQQSENPSEFLSEEFLASVKVSEIIEDDANMEFLGINVIPSKFRALA